MAELLPIEMASCLRDSPLISDVLDHWDRLDLAACWLVAGAVVQTWWNQVHQFPPTHGIKDVDLVYFEDSDLSEQCEAHNSVRINKLFHRLGVRFDVTNQARVHQWYEQRFGYSIDPYESTEAAIATFPTTAGAIGIRPGGSELEAFAPFGFQDLRELVVRPNKVQITASIYAEKTRRWKAIWPKVNILSWEQA